MPVTKPYYLTVRQRIDDSYDMSGNAEYIKDSRYSDDPMAYIRGFQLIQKDLLTIFEYIEPAQQNIDTYSLRTFELLLRTCTEIEANFKAILRANTFTPSPSRPYINMKDYYKINTSHFLSEYEVSLPHWKDGGVIRKPFSAWGSGSFVQLPWYNAYNQAKHDRTQNLNQATLGNLVEAYCALATIIASQFYTFSFSSEDGVISVDDDTSFISAAGSYVSIKFPQNTPTQERYDFMWNPSSMPDPFQKFDFDAIPNVP